MSNRLSVRIEGIDDPAVVADIETTIRLSFQHMALPGSWRVDVKPATTSGRWDFRVYGLDARHTLSIAVPPTLLSSLIPLRLRVLLERPDLMQPAGRPPTRAGDGSFARAAGTAATAGGIA